VAGRPLLREQWILLSAKNFFLFFLFSSSLKYSHKSHISSQAYIISITGIYIHHIVHQQSHNRQIRHIVTNCKSQWSSASHKCPNANKSSKVHELTRPPIDHAGTGTPTPPGAAAVATRPTQTPVASPANCEAAEGQVSATGQVAPTASHPKESAELAGTRRMLQAHHLMPPIDPA
jgi:hypothetical protein